LGKLLVIVGLVIAGVGALISFGVPLGRLPGDIVVRRDNFTFYFPLTTSIVVSVVVTLLVAFLRR
jgi:formate hydrogenlyase subunit 3/multisubunit Na+/H+ antiporter MnhD subunit